MFLGLAHSFFIENILNVFYFLLFSSLFSSLFNEFTIAIGQRAQFCPFSNQNVIKFNLISTIFSMMQFFIVSLFILIYTGFNPHFNLGLSLMVSIIVLVSRVCLGSLLIPFVGLGQEVKKNNESTLTKFLKGSLLPTYKSRLSTIKKGKWYNL